MATKKELESKIEILEDMISDLSYLITNHIGESTNNNCNITKKDCYNKIMCSNCKHALFDRKDITNKGFICGCDIECENFDMVDNSYYLKENYATVSKLSGKD